jgi:hypothetical protein
MLKAAVDSVRDPQDNINWSKVSTEMGGIRSRQQCQEKWCVPDIHCIVNVL